MYSYEVRVQAGLKEVEITGVVQAKQEGDHCRIVNLPPRKMMGIDSCGMLISAVHEEGGKEGLNLLMVDDRIPTGAKLY